MLCDFRYAIFRAVPALPMHGLCAFNEAMMSRFTVLVLIAVSHAASANAERITVAVAANFLTTAQDISAAFEAETGHDVVLAHGSTGKLYAQIVNGAPYDLFLSADQLRPVRLAEQDWVAEGGLKPYALGRLVLACRPSLAAGALEEILTRPGLRLAIADPAVAPYGVAAASVLRRMREGNWARGLVFGESVGQAFAFVATGNADAALIGLAQAQSLNGGGQQLLVPESLHPPIRQDAVLLIRAADSEAAWAFYEFLGSGVASRILNAAGYGVP